MKFTHKDLVRIAKDWALGRHNLVINERGAGIEIPDVMAFSYDYTTLIEVKISRSDFYRDKKKAARRYADICMGNYRIYCVPKGLLTYDDIPETWGLLEVNENGIARLKVNLYKHQQGAIWWHEKTVKSMKFEQHILLNHILFPRKLLTPTQEEEK